MQLIGVPEQAEKDVVVEAVIDLKSAKIDEGYTMDAIKSRKVGSRDLTMLMCCLSGLKNSFLFLIACNKSLLLSCLFGSFTGPSNEREREAYF